MEKLDSTADVRLYVFLLVLCAVLHCFLAWLLLSSLVVVVVIVCLFVVAAGRALCFQILLLSVSRSVNDRLIDEPTHCGCYCIALIAVLR